VVFGKKSQSVVEVGSDYFFYRSLAKVKCMFSCSTDRIIGLDRGAEIKERGIETRVKFIICKILKILG
jgi:hypothetical protein